MRLWICTETEVGLRCMFIRECPVISGCSSKESTKSSQQSNCKHHNLKYRTGVPKGQSQHRYPSIKIKQIQLQHSSLKQIKYQLLSRMRFLNRLPGLPFPIYEQRDNAAADEKDNNPDENYAALATGPVAALPVRV